MRSMFRAMVITVLVAAAVAAPTHMQAAQEPATDQDQAPLAQRAPASVSNSVYVVQMSEPPAGSYTGGIPGFAATKPGRGQKLDPNDSNVIGYAGFLDARHAQAFARAGGGRKLYDYRFSFNGFAAELSEDQAAALRGAVGVVSVTRDELVTAATATTPRFLGLDQPGGGWEQAGGVGEAGEDIVIGVIDSGIWPENPSFSDRTGANGPGSKAGKLSYQQIPGWHGKCTPGEAFPASMCNQKLIGAQRFNEAWGGDAGLKSLRPWEFASPRDYNGHGSHTASTSGGNNGVALPPQYAAFGSVSGIAPRARIAVYKALWSTQDASTASGFTSDLVAAIDQAVIDGVDVINYSISGTRTNFVDPAEVAFLFAADAGVFVAAAAGNSGPTAQTVVHPSPWIATVAAGTHDRSPSGSVTLGNGVTYTGASVAPSAVGPVPLIDSSAAGLPGADPAKVALCYAAIDNGGTAVLDPVKVAGKIVVCDRGVTARVNKSLAVQQASGVGMVLVNVTSSSLNGDFHAVPSVHLSHLDRAAVKAYAAFAGATAKINLATMGTTAAPFTASFSSRGPLRAGAGDLLKPDLIAPGQDVLAAVAPPGNGGANFSLYSGTSMATPHVAGLAALLKDIHPDWSPMMIKSALMTSASDVLDGPNTSPSVIFRQGAGHVRPTSAGDPGLVYDSNIQDWFAFLCGTTAAVVPATCTGLAGAGYSLDPSDFNGASIAIGAMAGVQTVTRRVTNVGGAAATYTASVTGLTGITTTLSPASFTLAPGATQSFTVTFTRTTATLNTYVGGQLTWSDGTHSVRSPIVVRPVALLAPASVVGFGNPVNYNVTFGYSGAFAAAARGLVPATLTAGAVADDPTDSFSPTGPGVVSFPVTIAAGTSLARFALFDANVTAGSDLDIYVYSGTTLVAVSAGGTSAEQANLTNPPAGSYTVYVHGYGVTGTADFTLFSWQVGTTDAGNMSVTAPAVAVVGGTDSIGLSFSGLAPATKYLGAVAYSGAAGLVPTIVEVTTP